MIEMRSARTFNRFTVFSMALISLFILSLSIVAPAHAQAGDPVVIAYGESTAQNVNTSGSPPLKDFSGSPPVMAAAEVGDGAVVAGGLAGACRDNSWNNPGNSLANLDVLLDDSFQWMMSNPSSVLWYGERDATGAEMVYNDASACQQMIAALETKGYAVDNTIDGESTSISSSLLSSYDILVIPQLQLGESGTGGDPTLLSSSAVNAIVDFVEGGGGLLILEQADYDGNGYSKVQNKILESLGVDIRFQDDQIQDGTNNWGGQPYQPIVDVDTSTDIGSAYESDTGESKIGLDSLCSLRIVRAHDVNVRAGPAMETGKAGDTLTYSAKLVNIGTESDSYTISVDDSQGWSTSVASQEISLGSGESENIQFEVTVPEDLEEKMVNWVTVAAEGDSGASDNTRVRAVNIKPLEEPPYPVVRETFWFSTPDLRVESPAVPIMTGGDTGHSDDATARPPWPLLYGKGEYPPAAAAALPGDGRVIAFGIPALRTAPVDYYTNPSLSTSELAPMMARWLIDWDNPADYSLLYYVNDPEEYPGVFHIPSNVKGWLNDLENKLGFNVDAKRGGEITSDLLESYDVVHLGELKRAMSSSEKQAISEWVKAGGGLIITCQADYGGYSAVEYQNGVLEGIGVPIRFQDDQLLDEEDWVVDGAWFPQVLTLDPREENPEYDVWFPEHSPEILSLKPTVIRANDISAGYGLTVRNGGTVKATLSAEVTEITSNPLGWSFNVEPAEVELDPGENAKIYVSIDIPNTQEMKRADWEVKVTDLSADYLYTTQEFATLSNPSWEAPEADYKVGDSVTVGDQDGGTVQGVMYNGEELVYSIEMGDGAVEHATQEELGAGDGDGDGDGDGGGISMMLVAVVVVVVVVIAGLVFWMKGK